MSEINIAWTTNDELKAISFMASKNSRGYEKPIPTVEQRIYRLETWLKHSATRIWPPKVRVDECVKYAYEMIDNLCLEANVNKAKELFVERHKRKNN